jgi:hypothetical protein
MAKPGTAREEIAVILPPEPPELNARAARVLLVPEGYGTRVLGAAAVR